MTTPSRDDGSEKFRYSTTSRMLADAVQEIALKLGFNPKVKFEPRSCERHLDMYRVYWATVEPQRTIKKKNIALEEYDGKVWCLTVPTGLLVTRRNGFIGIHGNSGKVLQLTNEYELIDNEITNGLMLNNAILNGEGPSYSNAQVGLITMAKRLERFRQEVSYWIEERILRPVSEWNGFVTKGKRDQEEYVVPTIKWDDLQLRDESSKLQTMMQARQAGDISAETIIESLGLDYDQEVERLRMEQMANMVSGPGGGGPGGAPPPGMGGGFGGGGDAGGGMPPMPGGEGGVPPPGGPPGVPGGQPAGEGMPPMAGAASSNPYNVRTAELSRNAEIKRRDGMYRAAAKSANSLYKSRVGAYFADIQRRYAKNGYKSDAHRQFLQSVMPVSVKLNAGPLPGTMDSVFPMEFTYLPDGGPCIVPMNRQAYSEFMQYASDKGKERARKVTASLQTDYDYLAAGLEGLDFGQDPRHERLLQMSRTAAPKPKAGDAEFGPKLFFTKLEQKLYNLIIQAHIPIPFYAQYAAGPNQKYQLDGAFPSVKLGVEADSDLSFLAARHPG